MNTDFKLGDDPEVNFQRGELCLKPRGEELLNPMADALVWFSIAESQGHPLASERVAKCRAGLAYFERRLAEFKHHHERSQDERLNEVLFSLMPDSMQSQLHGWDAVGAIRKGEAKKRRRLLNSVEEVD